MGRKKSGVMRYQPFLLTLLLAGGILVIYLQFDEPLRRYLKGVKTGVTIEGEAMGGMFRSEVAAVVARVAATQGRMPVDAELDKERDAIIPGLNGFEIDVAATVEKVMEAKAGTAVTPVYRELPPEICWEHYPEKPAYRGNPRKPAVALMINVAWGESFLPSMLEVLAEEECRATFFLVGRWAEQNEELVHKIAAGGHGLGNHGYDDSTVITALDSLETARSLQRTNEIIFDASGKYPLYFTPHKGEFNTLNLEVVSRQGMRTVLWSLDTVDWLKPGVEAMYDKISSGLAPGQIILMHPLEDTVSFLKLLLPLIRERGLAVVSVEQLLDPCWFPEGGMQ